MGLRFRQLGLGVGCLALAACLGDPVGTSGGAVLEPLAASLDSTLVGAPGRLLSQPLSWRLVDDHGRPVPGSQLKWSVVKGGGSLVGTDSIVPENGVFRTGWILGKHAADSQVVHVSAFVEGKQVAQAEIGATAVPVEVVTLRMLPDTLDVHLGVPLGLAAIATDSFGNTFVPRGLTFTSLDTTGARVDTSGTVSVRRRGYVSVQAKASGVTSAGWVHGVQTVQSIVVTQDTLRFHSLTESRLVGVTLIDDHQLPVVDSLPALTLNDTSVISTRWDTGLVVQSLTNGTSMVHLSTNTTSRDVLATVQQRTASLSFIIQGIGFDALGDTLRVALRALDSAGVAIVKPRITLSSSDTGVVSVDSSGLVTARRNGTVTLSARSLSGVTTSVPVAVVQRVSTISVARDSLRFDALHATLSMGAVPRDRLGSPVTGAVTNYSSSDTAIVKVDTSGGAHAVGNGVATAWAIADSDTARVSVVVSQRPTSVRLAKDTLSFDALGVIDTISATAFDSLGSPISAPVTGLSIADTTVVQQINPLALRASANGLTIVKFMVDGMNAQALAAVHQVPTRVLASLMTADSVVDLPIGSLIPMTCEARDRNGYVVPGSPVVEPSSGQRWVGNECNDLRMLRSGFDTLRVTAGTVGTSLDVQLMVGPPDFSGAPSVVERTTAGPSETFITWWQDPQAPGAAVWTRMAGASSWVQQIVANGRTWVALPGNPPGMSLEVAVALTDAQGDILGFRHDTVVVEDGATCNQFAGYSSTNLRLFCTGPDLISWVAEQGLDPQSVRCGTQSLSSFRDGLPNCVFVADTNHFVLLRGLDYTFRSGSPVSTSLLRSAYLNVVFGRSTPEATIWQPDPGIGTPIPVARVGSVTGYQSAVSWTTDVNEVGVMTLFEPPSPNGGIVIYQEGHGGEATDIGAETISWLLQRGWSVVALNLPRIAHMALRDAHPEDDNPLWRMLYGIGEVTEWIHSTWAPGRDPVVVAMGRSGGGWASLMYAALDPRIDATAVVAGFVPVNLRLDPAGRNPGDWEQIDPTTFGFLDYTDMVRLANTRDLLLTYAELDECCFRVTPSDPFAQWLTTEAGQAPATLTTVISSGDEHGLSADGYAALQDLLDRALARGH